MDHNKKDVLWMIDLVKLLAVVKEAKKYEDTITVTKGDKSAEAKKLMALLGLCVVKGETVTVSVEGANEDITVIEMEKFFKENL